MKVAVVGLGSMGKRRVRLIRELYPNYEIVGVDSRIDRQQEVTEQSGIKTFSSLSEINCDCAFVCTQPLSHANIITACLEKGWNVFTELNLVDDGYDKNMKLAKEKGVKLFLSSTFLYREEIKFLIEHVKNSKKWNYIYHIGQYLPDWHPWESYKDFFVGDKRTNGCREILSVELPWLIAAFGNIKDVHVVSDKITGLDIDYNDNYMLQLQHENDNKGALIVDVVSPNAVRLFEAYTEGSYFSWGGKPDTLYAFDSETKTVKNITPTEQTEHRDGYASFVVENAYKNEIREFFDVVLNGKQPLYGFEEDKSVLTLISHIGA